MHGRHEYRGFWWPADDPSHQLPGTLTVDKGKATLDLIGDFGRQLISSSPREKAYSWDAEPKPRLLGTSVDGKDITVEGAWETNSSVHFPGLPTTIHCARAVLVGGHFASDEETRFDEIAISASDLNTWSSVSGFKTSIETEDINEQGHQGFVGAEARYVAPEEVSIPLGRGEEIALGFTFRGEGLPRPRDRVELRQEAAVHWRFPRPVDLPSVFKKVSQIRDFLSLAVGRPVSITSVVGFKPMEDEESAESRRPVELLWQIPHNPEPPKKAREPWEMLFTLAEIPDASKVLRRWMARQDRLEPVFNLYFGTLYHPDLYLEVRFLSLAQALETYDFRRRRKPGKKTLAERTHDVLAQCRTVTRRIVGPDRDRFVDDFKYTRNYYTHYNPRLKAKAASGAALLLLTLQLQVVLELSFLRQLGFPCKSIEEVLERARRFEQIELIRSQVTEAEAPC